MFAASIGIAATNGIFSFGFRASNIFSYGFGSNDFEPNIIQTSTGWTMWSGTFISTGTMTRNIYKNGQLLSTDTPASSINVINGPIRIGAWITGVSHWSGSIDEFRFWSKTLTATQILNAYNNIFLHSNLEIYYKLNDAQSYTTIVDYSGKQRTLTKTGTPMFELDYSLCAPEITVSYCDRNNYDDGHYKFDGSASYLSSTAYLSLSGDFAFSFWYRRDSINVRQDVINAGVGGSDGTFLAIAYLNNNQFAFSFSGGDLITTTTHTELTWVQW
jgi:hypothetical protein